MVPKTVLREFADTIKNKNYTNCPSPECRYPSRQNTQKHHWTNTFNQCTNIYNQWTGSHQSAHTAVLHIAPTSQVFAQQNLRQKPAIISSKTLQQSSATHKPIKTTSTHLRPLRRFLIPQDTCSRAPPHVTPSCRHSQHGPTDNNTPDYKKNPTSATASTNSCHSLHPDIVIASPNTEHHYSSVFKLISLEKTCDGRIQQ